MTSILQFLPTPDVRTQNLFLVSPQYAILIVVAAYLLFIYKIGPALMKNRPPFELKGIIIAYNLMQVFFNAALFIRGVPLWRHVNLFCGPVDKSLEPTPFLISQMVYCYFLLKLLDLVETIFFVLRKKYNQVSSLHVFHHIAMVMGVWMGVRYYPGGQLIYLGVFNTVAHTFMYIYYLLTIWDPTYKESIWWKKHLTQLQIAHQICILVTMTAPIYMNDCPFPKFPCYVIGINASIIIPMFLNFYLRNYVLSKKVSSA